MIREIRLMKYAVAALKSFFFGVMLGGFCFGFVNCKDCGVNVLGRAVVGLGLSVLTAICAGFPPRNAGGRGEPFNVWPYIIPAWVVVFVLNLWRQARKTAKAKPGDTAESR